MLAKSVMVLLLGAGLGLIGGCSTPCDGFGSPCAPVTTLRPAPRQPALPPPPAPEPEPEAQTFSVAMPDLGQAAMTDAAAAGAAGAAGAPGADMRPGAALPDSSGQAPLAGAVPGVPAMADAGGATLRIGLMLPLHSDTLAVAADQLRAGFMAAYERDRNGVTVTVIDSGDSSADVLAAYTRAQPQQDIIVGPLARSAVNALAASGLVQKPTIALNRPDGRNGPALPPAMLAIGLSIEDEARDVANWAGAEQPVGDALVLASGTSWQRRIADAFDAQWQTIGRQQQTVDLSAVNGYLSDAELVQLRARLQSQPPALLFAAMDADQLRQLKIALGALGADLPVYGTSSLNPGSGRGEAGTALDGVRLLDLPWQVQRDHPAVMGYPQPTSDDQRKLNADMERLYALGIDAYRVARALAPNGAERSPGGRFTLDGVTGKLVIGFGQGPASFERSELQAQYQNGVALPLAAAAVTPVPAPPVAN